MLQTLNNRSLTEPVPSIPEGFEMTVWLVFGQTLLIIRCNHVRDKRTFCIFPSCCPICTD
jgi:hypothetical protein